MTSSLRVLVNTLAQYLRTFFSVIISLYTSRVVLANLGVDDFGIFSLVGGVIALLGFVQNNLSRTIQRYLSYYQGKGDFRKVINIFNNSVCTQLFFGVLLCGLLIGLTPVIFSYFIKITPERINAAQIVYWLTVINLFFNIISAPYLAALIARENIVFTSIVSLLDSILKIPVALSLIYISANKLECYALMMSLLSVLNYLIYYFYCHFRYDECQHFSIRSFQKNLFVEMMSFMGWGVYGTMCVAARTQGIAILLNNFFSTAVNAAYGIGGQVAGQVNFLSNAITTAINPQIIKAEGGGDRKKMFRLSEISCKFSYLLMNCIAIPSILFMDRILSYWLIETPQYTSMFCNMILLSILIDLTTLNLNTTNQAVGNVKVYSICINTIKILMLPVAYIALCFGCDPIGVMIVYVVFEAICAASRLIFLKINVNLSIKNYINNVFVGISIVSVINLCICYFIADFLDGVLFILCYVISFMVTSLSTWFWGLKSDEKTVLCNIAKKFMKR